LGGKGEDHLPGGEDLNRETKDGWKRRTKLSSMNITGKWGEEEGKEEIH